MLDILKSHASVRKYKDEKITDEQFHELLIAAQHAASSNFVQAYSVIHVTDEDKRKQLAKLSKNEMQYNSAALALVFCADLRRVEMAIQDQPKEIKADTYENFIVSVVDTALFAQNFVVACESKGYGICYIGGVRNNPQQISDLLNLPDKVIPLFGMTVGVPDEENEVKPRFPVEAILHENSYDEAKYGQLLKEYDNIMNAYYNERITNKKDANWSNAMTEFMTDLRRPHMKDFLTSKGYLKK